MKVDFGGRAYDLDTQHVTFKHALAIQDYTGMSIADWEDSLDFKTDDKGEVINPPPKWLKSVGALYWLMLAQNGDTTKPDDIDFDFAGFLVAYMTAVAAEITRAKAEAAKAEAEPDPTLLRSLTASPASQASATPTITTLTPPGRQEGEPAIVS